MATSFDRAISNYQVNVMTPLIEYIRFLFSPARLYYALCRPFSTNISGKLFQILFSYKLDSLQIGSKPRDGLTGEIEKPAWHLTNHAQRADSKALPDLFS